MRGQILPNWTSLLALLFDRVVSARGYANLFRSARDPLWFPPSIILVAVPCLIPCLQRRASSKICWRDVFGSEGMLDHLHGRLWFAWEVRSMEHVGGTELPKATAEIFRCLSESLISESHIPCIPGLSGKKRSLAHTCNAGLQCEHRRGTCTLTHVCLA